MKKLFIGALALAGATLILAIVAPGVYNDMVNAIVNFFEWARR